MVGTVKSTVAVLILVLLMFSIMMQVDLHAETESSGLCILLANRNTMLAVKLPVWNSQIFVLVAIQIVVLRR
jgi:hypothetical protein